MFITPRSNLTFSSRRNALAVLCITFSPPSRTQRGQILRKDPTRATTMEIYKNPRNYHVSYRTYSTALVTMLGSRFNSSISRAICESCRSGRITRILPHNCRFYCRRSRKTISEVFILPEKRLYNQLFGRSIGRSVCQSVALICRSQSRFLRFSAPTLSSVTGLVFFSSSE